MVTVAAIVKNEADWWLRDAVKVWSQFATRIVCLDDGSDDGSGELVERAATVPTVVERREVGLYGNSSGGRQALWDLACAHTPIGDHIFVLDADMIPSHDPRPHLTVDSVSFVVFDLWGPGIYRSDAFWTAHCRPRVWATRKMHDGPWEWEDVKAHSGHFPLNISQQEETAPVALLHYGYSTTKARQRQHAKYSAKMDILTQPQRFHVKTILTENPRTLPLPFDPEYTLE